MINPENITHIELDARIAISPSIYILAPRINGIDITNENLTASFFFIPTKIAHAIVIPDLDIPGSNAKDCINPIKIAVL